MQSFRVDQKHELQDRLFDDFDYVLMSDIGRGSYLIVINWHGCFDYNKKTMILNQIDSAGLSANWYDKQDFDLMVKFRDDTNLITMDLCDSAKEILNDYWRVDNSQNVLSAQKLSMLNTHENNMNGNNRRGNDMGTSMIFY